MLKIEYFDTVVMPDNIDELDPLDVIKLKDPEGLKEEYGKYRKMKDYMDFGLKDRTGLSITEWLHLPTAESEFILNECKTGILKDETITNQTINEMDKLEKGMVPTFSWVGKR